MKIKYKYKFFPIVLALPLRKNNWKHATMYHSINGHKKNFLILKKKCILQNKTYITLFNIWIIFTEGNVWVQKTL